MSKSGIFPIGWWLLSATARSARGEAWRKNCDVHRGGDETRQETLKKLKAFRTSCERSMAF